MDQSDEYSDKETKARMENAIRRTLKTPPKPHAQMKAKGKPSPFPPATNAERAALKRIDKMVIKRMRKR